MADPRIALDKIIARFPFAEIREHMLARRWTWSPIGRRTPTPDQMIDTVLACFLIAKEHEFCSTGGFTVHVLPDSVIVQFTGRCARGARGPVWSAREAIDA